MKVLHGTWSCSLNQLNEGTIKNLSPPYVRVLQIDIGFKHNVLVCFNGIAKTFGNLKYVRPPNEGIADCASRVFSMMGGIANPTYLKYIVLKFIKQLGLD